MTRLVWRTAKDCNHGECVEVAPVIADGGNGVIIRDSKDPDGSTLSFSKEEFMIFIEGAKCGDFDDLI